MAKYREDNADKLDKVQRIWRENNTELRKAYKARIYKEWKEAYLCRQCGRKAFPFTLCEKHRRAHRLNDKGWRKKARDGGRCPKCAIDLHFEMDKGFVNCTTCRERSVV